MVTPLLPDKNHIAVGAVLVLLMKRFQLLLTKILPYAAVFAVIFAVMFFGTQNQRSNNTKPITANFDDNNFTVTSDQVSEFYIVANIANTVDLPSTASISENYVTINKIYETTGTTNTSGSSTIEKPTVIDVSDLNIDQVVTHTVAQGDTLANIIVKYNSKATKDQIRWSNGMKNETLTVGKSIYVPLLNGIVYKAKSGDTPESLAKKYGSDAELIIAYNNLENKTISANMMVLLPNGTLPEKERPEYVAPTPCPTTPSYSYTYSYVYDSGVRHGVREINNYSYWNNMYYSTSWQHNPGAYGNCTWFAWYWRRNFMGQNYWLPTGPIGNASSWVYSLSGSYYVGRTPAYGAVMQSTSGYYGHVAVVVGVNEGTSITIQEMNWNGGFNRVYQSTINWSDAVKYNYIYGHK